ncbi:MAG: purine-nucleoside phosphorylase [Omnitrophica bacterium GWA2_52_8]|nr:MAG: purine-nucleoside phosphorylase [Omnitrophica bacterium GWA2_52_8]
MLMRIREAAETVKERTSLKPDIAIILGTGLGNLTQKVEVESTVDYSDIAHFPQVTVESHQGKLVLGHLSGKKVAVMVGRFHYYEGYAMQDITFPVRVLRELGAKILVVSNASGGLNPAYQKGDIAVIEDHINFMPDNPLRGTNDERIGHRFPDMSEPYSRRLVQRVVAAADALKLKLQRGVYVGVAGPNLETRAEYRMLRNWGADLVGMSTIPEVLAGVHMGMEVLGLSVVTDVCDPDHLKPVDIKEIIHVANAAGPKLDSLLVKAIAKF